MKLALLANEAKPRAREAAAALRTQHAFVAETEAEVGVVVGGDGFMLHSLHRLLDAGRDLPLYGLNLGTVGFLMNAWHPDEDLPSRVAAALPTQLHPLTLSAQGADGSRARLRAINEISLFRASAQTAAISVDVDGDTEIGRLMADGVLVATPAGSTAYNRSAGGPVIPLGASLLAITPVAPFHPRNWKGALLPYGCCVSLQVLDPDKRPVHAAADSQQVDRVVSVDIREHDGHAPTLLFDVGHSLERRILREQFPG